MAATVLETRPPGFEAEIVAALMRDEVAADQARTYLALYLIAVADLPSERERAFRESVSTSISGNDLKEAKKLIYDGAHEASFLMDRQRAAVLMAMLESVPDPYPEPEIWDSPELIAAVERADADYEAGRTIRAEAFFG